MIEKMKESSPKQKFYYDRKGQEQSLVESECIWVKLKDTARCMKGIMIRKKGPPSFDI